MKPGRRTCSSLCFFHQVWQRNTALHLSAHTYFGRQAPKFSQSFLAARFVRRDGTYKIKTNEPQLIQSLHVINRSKLFDFCTCEFSSTPSLNARTAKCSAQYRTISHAECGTPYGSAKRNSRPRNHLGLLRSSMLGAKLKIARDRHGFEQSGTKEWRETHRLVSSNPLNTAIRVQTALYGHYHPSSRCRRVSLKT